jgi:hypothetical protein
MKIKDLNGTQKWRGDIATKTCTCIKFREKVSYLKAFIRLLILSHLDGEVNLFMIISLKNF